MKCGDGLFFIGILCGVGYAFTSTDGLLMAMFLLMSVSFVREVDFSIRKIIERFMGE